MLCLRWTNLGFILRPPVRELWWKVSAVDLCCFASLTDRSIRDIRSPSGKWGLSAPPFLLPTSKVLAPHKDLLGPQVSFPLLPGDPIHPQLEHSPVSG